MKKSLYLSFAYLWLLCLTACSTDDEPRSFEPRLFIGEATEITRTTATISGSIELEGETPMPELCFHYGTTAACEGTSNKVKPKDGRVSYNLRDLMPGRTYYYFLESANGRVMLQSPMASFTTEPNEKPKVGEACLLSLAPLSVVASATVLDDGGEALTGAGFYLSVAGSDKSVRFEAELSADMSEFKLRIGGLLENTSYELTPFASNTAGESMGKTATFVTSSAIKLDEAGTLGELLGDSRFEITSVSIAGELNGDDLRCLREMMGCEVDGEVRGKLADANLAEMTIVAGGGPYDGEHFAEDNIVGQGLFADCKEIENITLPEHATAIGKDAFNRCSALRSIVIPANVSSLVPSTDCPALEVIAVSEANDFYSSIDGVLFNAAVDELVWYPVGKTGYYELPATVAALGDYAFEGCRLTSIVLPDALTNIGLAVFKDSTLERIVMPGLLKTIPKATFQDCFNLKEVHLGELTELVGDYTFSECPLEALYIKAEIPPVCSKTAFGTGEEIFDKCILYVPTQSKSIYRNHQRWGQFSKIRSIE